MLIHWLSTFVAGAGLGTLVSALFLSKFAAFADVVGSLGWVGGIVSAVVALFVLLTENDYPHVVGGSGLFLGLFSGFAIIATQYWIDTEFAPLAWLGGFLLLLGGFYSLLSLQKAKK